jgi:hypothetical protein
MVEIRDRDRVAVHLNVAETVDAILRGQPFPTQIRFRNERGQIETYEEREDLSNDNLTGAQEYFANRANSNSNNNFAASGNVYGYDRDGRDGRDRNNRRPTTASPNNRGNVTSVPANFFPGAAPYASVIADSEPELLRIAPAAPTNRYSKNNALPVSTAKPLRIFPHGVNRNRLEQVIKDMGLPADIVRDVTEADMVLTLKNYYRQRPLTLRQAESDNTPIYILKSNTAAQMENCLADIFNLETDKRPPSDDEDEDGDEENNGDPVKAAMYEAEEAITKVMQQAQAMELTPQNSFIRRLQHQMAERYNLTSQSKGREPFRRVRILPHN